MKAKDIVADNTSLTKFVVARGKSKCLLMLNGWIFVILLMSNVEKMAHIIVELTKFTDNDLATVNYSFDIGEGRIFLDSLKLFHFLCIFSWKRDCVGILLLNCFLQILYSEKNKSMLQIGGYLIHKVLWHCHDCFDAICTIYLKYMINNYCTYVYDSLNEVDTSRKNWKIPERSGG